MRSTRLRLVSSLETLKGITCRDFLKEHLCRMSNRSFGMLHSEFGMASTDIHGILFSTYISQMRTPRN